MNFIFKLFTKGFPLLAPAKPDFDPAPSPPGETGGDSFPSPPGTNIPNSSNACLRSANSATTLASSFFATMASSTLSAIVRFFWISFKSIWY